MIIDTKDTMQTIEGWGTSLCWWANVLGSKYKQNKVYKQVMDAIFEKNGLSLNIVRYNIGGTDPNCKEPWFKLGRAIECYINPEGSYNWESDKGQRDVLLFARDNYDINQIEAFSNSPPYFMTTSGSTTGSETGTTDNLKSEYYQPFVNYLISVSKHFIEKYNLAFTTIAPFNEPISLWWKKGNNQEGCHFDVNTQSIIIGQLYESLQNELTLKKNNITISSSDENSIDQSVETIKHLSPSALSKITRINTHSYNGSMRCELKQIAEQNKKQLWMSEYGCGDYPFNDVRSGIQLSNQITKDLNEMKCSAWIYWQVVEAAEDGNNWGMIKLPFVPASDDQVISISIGKQYYAMAQYSRFIKKGYQIINVDKIKITQGTSLIAAVSEQDSTLVLVYTNSVDKSFTIDFDLSSFIDDKKQKLLFKMFRTSQEENCKFITEFTIDTWTISPMLINNQSITTFIIKKQ
ncbi:hypothetical protein AKO1_000918 [Acrasis kona]|uniref:Endo-beta-1,6-galactanase-like domain-containing protein n=1 Tax=Acrasis kona TaxID=1008807 RepID=A0AAW2ZPT7_9EUKA